MVAMKTEGYDRDAIRSALFSGAPQFRSQSVELPSGIEVEVRQPTIRVRRELFNQCMDASGNLDANDFLIKSILKNTFVPGTKDQRVFDDADYDSILNQPTGGWVDQLIDAMSGLTNPENSGKDLSGSGEDPNNDSSS